MEPAVTSSPSRPAAALRARRRTLTAVVVLSLWGLATHGTHAGSGDEPHYVAIAHSIAFDGDFDLSNNYGVHEPLIASGTLEAGEHARPGRDGIVRPVHDVGLPLVLAPYVRLVRPLVAPLLSSPDSPTLRRLRLTPSTAYRHVLSALMIVVAALLARELFGVLVRTGSSPAAAFWIALLVSLSPPLLIFSILTFTELTSALLCLVVFRRIVLDPPASHAAWAALGAAAGALLLLHVRNVGLVAPLALLGVWTAFRRGSAAAAVAFVVPLAAMTAVRTVIIHAFWGTYFTSPHARPGPWPGLVETITVSLTRLGGMLLDQEFGLLPYAPVFLLAGLGLPALRREGQHHVAARLAAVAAGYLLLVCLPVTNVHGWTGGWNPPARFLVPLVPLLIVPVGAAVRAVPRGIVVCVVAAQVIVSAYFWQRPKDLWNDGDGTAAVCARYSLSLCEYLPAFPTETAVASGAEDRLR